MGRLIGRKVATEHNYNTPIQYATKEMIKFTKVGALTPEITYICFIVMTVPSRGGLLGFR